MRKGGERSGLGWTAVVKAQLVASEGPASYTFRIGQTRPPCEAAVSGQRRSAHL